jgi:hypothetical protein
MTSPVKVELETLRPELIGAVFGRHAASTSARGGEFGPRVRPTAIGVTCLVAVLALASWSGMLSRSAGLPSPLQLIWSPREGISAVGFSLLEDPVGLCVLVVGLSTPIFCAEQVIAIRDFLPMNERNVGYRADLLPVARINEHVAVANRRFGIVGGRPFSIAAALFSLGISHLLYRLAIEQGLLRAWNPTSLPDERWSALVLAGWWANPRTQPGLALCLQAIGGYSLYFLTKQVAMGAVFAEFTRSTVHLGVGVAPSLAYNRDGYWGLRPLRRFMQWTYGSTSTHFVVGLGVSVVWLPFGRWTVFLAVVVGLANALLVLYPSSIAFHATVEEKVRFIDRLMALDLPDAEKERQIERIWTVPNLPFRTRSSLTALSVYLLVPLFLAIVSANLAR